MLLKPLSEVYALTIWTLLKKHLFRNKAKVLLMTVSLVSIIAIITSLYHLLQGLNEGLSKTFDQLGANIIVSPKQDNIYVAYGPVYIGGEMKTMHLEDLGVIGKIYNNEYIAYISPKLLDKVKIKNEYAGLIGVKFKTEKAIRNWVHYDGQYPANEHEIMLGAKLARQLNAKTGTVLTIKNERFTVSGVFEELENEEDQLLFMDLEKAQSLLGRGTEISLAEVVAFCYSCPIYDMAGDIRSDMKNVNVKPLQDIALAREETIDKFRMFFYAVAIIIVFSGIYVLMRMMSTYVRSRSAEIGLLRTIGFSNKLIDQLILTEAFTMGLTGGIVGYIVGMGIDAIIIRIWFQDQAIVTTHWEAILGTIVLSILMIWMASIGPTRYATTLDPVEAMKKF